MEFVVQNGINCNSKEWELVAQNGNYSISPEEILLKFPIIEHTCECDSSSIVPGLRVELLEWF